MSQPRGRVVNCMRYRTAFASLLFFYDLNGMRLTLSHDDAFDLVIGIVTHELDIERAAKILQDHAVRR